jgi:hypothetical protein
VYQPCRKYKRMRYKDKVKDVDMLALQFRLRPFGISLSTQYMCCGGDSASLCVYRTHTHTHAKGPKGPRRDARLEEGTDCHERILLYSNLFELRSISLFRISLVSATSEPPAMSNTSYLVYIVPSTVLYAIPEHSRTLSTIEQSGKPSSTIILGPTASPLRNAMLVMLGKQVGKQLGKPEGK